MKLGKPKQSFEIGNTVNVGFLTGLVVLKKIHTEQDAAPDAFILKKKESFYVFVPHSGLQKLEKSQMGRNGYVATLNSGFEIFLTDSELN